MNAAQEMDDDRARCGILCRFVFGAEPVCKQDTKARSRISLQHVHDGLAGLGCLLYADRRENTVVDRIVQEKHLRRLDEDCRERKEICVRKSFNACREDRKDRCHERADEEVSENRDQHTEDTHGKVVDQHLKACRHMAVHRLIELFDDEACEGAHDHGAHEHRLSLCSVNPCDRAHDCDRADDASSLTADEIAALCGDQDREYEEKHIRVNGCKTLIRNPAVRNKKCRDEAPCDKRADIRHDHCGKKLSESL